MRTLLCAGLLAVSAMAACPNQCSGHGYCDQNDRCNCFRGPGTSASMRALWTGFDCSLRVCPYGAAYDMLADTTQELRLVSASSTAPNVGFIPSRAASVSKLRAFVNNGLLFTQDVGIDVRVVSVDTTQNTVNFQYKTSNQRTFNKENVLYASVSGATAQQFATRAKAHHVQIDQTGSGTPTDTGLYIFFDVSTTDLTTATQTVFPGDWYYLNATWNEGVLVDNSDDNTHHMNVECSGRGTCDRTAGTCTCDAGYTGDACQRTTCPQDCSGHGTCQTLNLFVQDGFYGTPYTGVEASQQMGCKCDDGFRGSDCSQIECPSGPDPLNVAAGTGGQDCSGRGLCDYTSGSCKCFKGFFGERCEEITNLV